MNRTAQWLLSLALTGPVATTGQAGVTYFDITGSTSGSSNACPIWIPVGNQDDCSYDASDPSGFGSGQWIGPVFGAGYYAPLSAPAIFTQPPAAEPIVAPAPLLPTGGKTGMPVTRGFLSIDDRNTPATTTDDIVGGTIEFGAFERNVGVGPVSRVVESFERIIHRIIPPSGQPQPGNVSSATANAAGGFDYVVGAVGTTSTFPDRLTGSTTANGGFSDDFPSEVASESSPDAGDLPYWTGPAANSIARLEDAAPIIGTTTFPTVWGYSCTDGSGSCVPTDGHWNLASRARFDNVILRFSTNSAGEITSAEAYLVNEFNGSPSVDGLNNDSWNATRMTFTGTADQRPEAFDDAGIIDLDPEDLSYLLQVLSNDVPGISPRTVTIVTPPTLGTATVQNNIISFVPTDYDAEGTDEITYLITDANNNTSTGMVRMFLTHLARCVSDIERTDQDVPAVLDVLANDGAFRAPFFVSIVASPEEGTAQVNPDNTITFTPPAGETGIFALTYQVEDADRLPSRCQATIDVNGDIAVADELDAENEVPIDVGVVANDLLTLLETPVEIVITAEPSHGAVIVIPQLGNSLPGVRYISDTGFTGSDLFRYRLRDATDYLTNEAVVTMNVIDSVPGAENDTFATVENDLPRSLTVLSNDNVRDRPASLVVVNQPAHGTAQVVAGLGNADPTITYTPSVGYLGPDSLSYFINDSDGESSNVATVTIEVIDTGPTVALGSSLDFTETGHSRAERVLRVPVEGIRVIDAPFTFEITQPPTMGRAVAVPGSATFDGLPDIVYASNVGSSGTDTFKYRVVDADGDLSPPGTATITITDGTPMANDDTATVRPGQAQTIGILGNDTGLVNTPVTVDLLTQPEHGRVTIRDNGPTGLPTVTYTPDAGFEGSDSFSYTVSDGDSQTSAEATVSLTIQPPPDSEPQAVDDPGSTTSGRWIIDGTGARNLENGAFYDVQANDRNLNDAPIRIEIVDPPDPALGYADVVPAGAGFVRARIRFASTPGSNGSTVIRYRLIDADGDVSLPATLTVTVGDTTPQALSDTAGITADLLPNDSEYITERIKTPLQVLNNDPGQNRTNTPLTIVITQQPAHGDAETQQSADENLGDFAITYTSDDNYVGPDSLRYKIRDADGDESPEVTVTFQVLSILTANGDPPNITSDVPFLTLRNRPIENLDVLANDGGFAYGPITLEIVATIRGAAVKNPDNTVTFTPERDFAGVWQSPNCVPPGCIARGGAGFRYRITDARNQVSEATVLIDVFPAEETEGDSGSSSLDVVLLSLLAAGACARRRRRLH
ncbi:MAG: tandem-95 repeat protein [Gammaproteobacteria bacterium]|nr:tandem-95 repeat protein [Gammaproteobacteria bacterium]